MAGLCWTGLIVKNTAPTAPHGRSISGTARGLFIVPSDLGDLERKGVAHLITERDEGGYFERVVSLHPTARATRRVEIAQNNTVVELALPPAPGWLGQLLSRAAHLLRAVRAARRLVREERLQLVRAQDPHLCGLIGWLASRRPRRPFAISIHADYEKLHELDGVHGAPRLFGSRALAQRLERFLLVRADLVMPIRRSLADRVIAGGCAPDKVRLIPHAVDGDGFVRDADPAALEPLGLPPGHKIISFVGRLSRENYVDDVVELARRLDARSDCLVVLFGGGSEEPRLRALRMADPALSRTLVLAGFQPRRAVAALRARSAVGLCLMGGFSLIEACATGCPVVAYDVDWHGELVITGQTGALVREGDIDALHRAVEVLLDSPEERTRMGRAARDLALARHAPQAAAAARQSCYDHLLGRRP